jgi:hypothetical protein
MHHSLEGLSTSAPQQLGNLPQLREPLGISSMVLLHISMRLSAMIPTSSPQRCKELNPRIFGVHGIEPLLAPLRFEEFHRQIFYNSELWSQTLSAA